MKVKKNELFFYMSYICIYISLFIGDIYPVGNLAFIAKMLRIFSYGIIAISVLSFRFSAKKIIELILIFVLTFSYGVSTGDFYWSVLILLIYSAKKIDINKIFDVSRKIIIFGILLVLFFCLIGILPDYITVRDINGLNENIRHSLGFYHSNVLPLLMLYLFVYYIFLFEEKSKNIVIVCFIVSNFILNIICNSRNAFILCLFLAVMVVYAKKKKKLPKFWGIITKFCVPFLAIFSYSMTFLLLKGGVWNAVDTFFSGRFRLAIFKIRRIGIHLINIMSNEEFIKDNVTYVNGKQLNTVVLDNGYLYVMIRYGILIVIFYFIVASLLYKKSKENAYRLAIILTVFIANFIDNDLVDYSFLPFILWAFNDLSIDSVMGKVKDRISKDK